MVILRDKGGFLSPTIRLIDHEGRPAVLKDFRAKNALTRGLIAPRLVKREFEILRKLEGIPGVPRTYGIIDKRALLLEYIEGRPINKFKAGDLEDAVFDRLRRLVRALHDHDVAHLDLRQRKNILITADGRPYVLDFANAVLRRGAAKTMWDQLVKIDESALLKFKQRNFPHLMTEADQEQLTRHKRLRRFWIFSPRGKSVR